jgi:hypothetical protein
MMDWDAQALYFLLLFKAMWFEWKIPE